MKKNKLSKTMQRLHVKDELKKQTNFISACFSDDFMSLDATGFTESQNHHVPPLDSSNNIDFELLKKNKKFPYDR